MRDVVAAIKVIRKIEETPESALHFVESMGRKKNKVTVAAIDRRKIRLEVFWHVGTPR
jgi:hypothetical protein